MSYLEKKRKYQRLWALLCIGLAIVLAGMVAYNRAAKRRVQTLIREMETATRPLYTQVHALEYQIRTLEQKKNAAQAGTATVQFFIGDLSARTVQKIVSSLMGYGYPVTIGLSVAQMPGRDGCITVEQAKELTAQGAMFCYAYDAEEAEALAASPTTALSRWLKQVVEAAAERGLTVGEAICFPKGTYQDSFSSVLKDAGISVVICDYGLNGGTLEAYKKNGFWFADTTWWRNNSIITSKLASIDSTGGEIVISMGIDDRWSGTLTDWMNQFQGIIKGLSVDVTDFPGMAETQAQNAEIGTESAAALDEEIATLNAQIKELNTQIEEIETQYGDEITKK